MNGFFLGGVNRSRGLSTFRPSSCVNGNVDKLGITPPKVLTKDN